MCIDSGSNKNIIGDQTWAFLNKMDAKLSNFEKGSDIIFKAYGNDTPLNVIGSFTANINVRKANSDERFYVIEGGKRHLSEKRPQSNWAS